MARKSLGAAAESSAPLPRAATRVFSILGTALNWTCAVCALIGCVWAVWQIENFVITDRRFQLQGPRHPGAPSEHFQVHGLVNTSEQRVINVFARDFGKSIYLCPIRERRRRLLAIDWVKEASVSRVWPNRIVVRVEERKPVAFVQVPAGNRTAFTGLVDEEGVLLDPQRSGHMSLPVLTGMPAKESESARRERVQRFLRLKTELGRLMDDLSEIDVSEPENLKVTRVVEGRAITLMLGNEDFARRYGNFLQNQAEIFKRLVNATVLDLRLRDRITAVATAEPRAAVKPKTPKKLRPKEFKR